ncbi:MAG: preprotein translocase subunit SecA [Oscillospiraceae bacterium]|nr:preprotein translocase subunit SecA [Oscillospiraceae bacterium]
MDKKAVIAKIKHLAESGNTEGNSVESVFARCYNAVRKTLDITPFDEQLSAALSLYEGRMVQMQTGEGKTLSAVFAACMEAQSGGSVHVLTFNDYLAKRDCEWMKPVYDEMGISVGYITEKTDRRQRRELYKKQVLYITAKEAGFDYLRDFVCFDPEEMVFPEQLNYAIVDEADSILIDEARIPLVIAGDLAVEDSSHVAEVYEKTADFTEDHFEFDDESRNVYLTDEGADLAEEIFGVNIYSTDGAELLAKICACLKARTVLKEDKDYIVKDGSILLVDEFTGRTAVGRVFPGELQPAVEAKHGLKITSRGRIMGNIALQYFARLYPKLCGMTGTAELAREEFEKLYALTTDVIPTRLPCAREDKPLEMYYDKEEKHAAVIAAICEAAEAQRPVLVGTESIEESEYIAEMLREKGVSCSVLNAKNDEEEAAIISRAGERGAVTISTNMAGRGVDIKLGGEDCREKDFVTEAGGLLVLATSMRESSRITKQLRGRAGRQGDIGESRYFSALDDDIFTRFELKKLAGRHYPAKKVNGAIEDKTLLKEAERVQRISEGDTFDERMNLMKYTMIGEKHRDITFRRRTALLDGSYNCELWQTHAPELYEEAEKKFGKDALQKKQNLILASLLNEFWCDYLDYTAYLREGIHLTQVAGRNPADEYNIACEEYYDSAADSIPERMTERLEALLECGSLEEYNVPMPSKTYTYLLDDQGEEFKTKPILMNIFSDDYVPDDVPDEDETEENAPEKEKKKGFFASLFGKKK